MLKMNGQPYATGRLEVPPLEDVVSDRSLPRELCGDEEGMPPDVLVEYACEDAYDTFLLYEFYKKKLMATPWTAGKTYWNYYDEVESLITEIITGIERRGMALDMPFLSEMKEYAEKQLEETEAEIIRFVGVPINIKSSKQRGHLLHGRGVMPIHRGKTLLYNIKGMGLPVMDTTQTGQPKVDAGTMRKLQRWAKKNRPTIVKFIDLMNLHSSIKTQLGTFLTGLKEKQIHGRIHTRINQIGVPTGRFSSSGPNLQNITTGEKDRFYLRHCFCASEGNILLDADYGQLEYRLLAHFTQDPALLKAFREGLDLHSLSTFNIYLPIQAAVKKNFGSDDINKDVLDWIAREFPDERKRGKTLNFEIIYGVGPHKLADQLEITLAEGKRMIEAWFFGYNHVRPWMRRELQRARSRGFIRTLMGRYRRTVPSRLSSHERRIRGREERILINAKIQGSAADVCERAMILIDQSEKLKELGVQMIMQIHDEILCECPADVSEAAALVKKEIMENPFSKPLRVPLPVDVGIGPTWASAKV
jgi:DNA polymerase-1